MRDPRLEIRDPWPEIQYINLEVMHLPAITRLLSPRPFCQANSEVAAGIASGLAWQVDGGSSSLLAI